MPFEYINLSMPGFQNAADTFAGGARKDLFPRGCLLQPGLRHIFTAGMSIFFAVRSPCRFLCKKRIWNAYIFTCGYKYMRNINIFRAMFLCVLVENAESFHGLCTDSKKIYKNGVSLDNIVFNLLK